MYIYIYRYVCIDVDISAYSEILYKLWASLVKGATLTMSRQKYVRFGPPHILTARQEIMSIRSGSLYIPTIPLLLSAGPNRSDMSISKSRRCLFSVQTNETTILNNSTPGLTRTLLVPSGCTGLREVGTEG